MMWLSFLYSWQLDSKSLQRGGIAPDALYVVSTSGPGRPWGDRWRARARRQSPLVSATALPPSICVTSQRDSFFLSVLLCKSGINISFLRVLFLLLLLNKAIYAKHLENCFPRSRNYLGVSYCCWIRSEISPSGKTTHSKEQIKTECSIKCITKIYVFVFSSLAK